ncbi:E3 ubiquitin-protein ligase TRIM39 [Esox lucius]|nr:E3 ubiquitin-protein ligase TRIM39 [Esox lucius]
MSFHSGTEQEVFMEMSAPPRCCICLDHFTSPVSIPCGHRFCLSCIGEYWRQCDSKCPLCMTRFPVRPQLNTEQTVHTGAPCDNNGSDPKSGELQQLQTEQTQHTGARWQENPDPLRAGEVPCNDCPEKRRRASKSCLVCLKSYCEPHLEPHYRDTILGRHPLVTVWKNLEDPVCRLHGRQLEKFCRSDQTLVCATCTQTDHRGHRLVTITKEAIKRKNKLKKSLIKVQQMIQEKTKKVEDIQLSVAIVDGAEKKTAAEKQAEGLIKNLEQEIVELKTRSSELEQLSHTDDHLHLLQRFPSLSSPLHTKDWSHVLKSLLHELQEKLEIPSRDPKLQQRKRKRTQRDKTLIEPRVNQDHISWKYITLSDMAVASSSSVSMDTPVVIANHLMCSICLGLFEDPVTTPCGHTFCQTCLDRNLQINDLVCPLCKGHLGRSPKVNIILRTLIEELKKANDMDPGEYSGAQGDVACDICTKRKLKAHKSCLVCLASYCQTHLRPHNSVKRLKGHRLVAPVEDLDGRACLTHGRPLELYSRAEGRCVCALCVDEGCEVVSAEMEWEQKKGELGSTKAEMQEKILERQGKAEEIRVSVEQCKVQINRERREIDTVFETLVVAVKEAQKAAVRPLEERQLVLEREAAELTRELEREIRRLKDMTAHMEDIAHLEDHIHFLQTFPSLPRQGEMRDWTRVSVDTTLSFGTMRSSWSAMLEKIKQELETLSSIELERIQKFEVDVTLDPDTANQQLIVSEDRKQVKDGGKIQDLPDRPDRFDPFGSILGNNKLNSGRSYWEVDVGNKTGWDVGIARGDANRKGKLSVNPSNGFWAIVHYKGDQYAALQDPPLLLSLRGKPQRVGVFLDYEEGLVSFYDVDAKAHIHSFTGCSFSGEICPYLSPHLLNGDQNSDPLVIT